MCCTCTCTCTCGKCSQVGQEKVWNGSRSKKIKISNLYKSTQATSWRCSSCFFDLLIEWWMELQKTFISAACWVEGELCWIGWIMWHQRWPQTDRLQVLGRKHLTAILASLSWFWSSGREKDAPGGHWGGCQRDGEKEEGGGDHEQPGINFDDGDEIRKKRIFPH